MSTSQETMRPTGPRRNHMELSDHSAPVYFDNPAWMEFGVCAQVGGDGWFPELGGSSRSAKRACLSCPVKDECLEYALDRNERFDIWGAKSERERRVLSKARAA